VSHSIYLEVIHSKLIRDRVIVHIELLRRFNNHSRFRVRVIRSRSSPKSSPKRRFSLGITEMFTIPLIRGTIG